MGLCTKTARFAYISPTLDGVAGYLGYRIDDYDTPFADFYQPEMVVLSKHVVDALNHGPQAEPTLTPFEDAVCLLDEGYQQT